MGAACSTHGAHKYLRNVGCKASRPNKTPGHGCEDNIKINLTETVQEGVDWIQLAQDRELWQGHVNTVMKHHGPWKAANFLPS